MSKLSNGNNSFFLANGMKTLWQLYVLIFIFFSLLSIGQGEVFAGLLGLIGAIGAFLYLLGIRLLPPAIWHIWIAASVIHAVFGFVLSPEDIGESYGAGIVMAAIGIHVFFSFPIYLAVYRYGQGHLHAS